MHTHRMLVVVMVLLIVSCCVPLAHEPALPAGGPLADGRLSGAWRAIGADAPLHAYIGPAREDSATVQIRLLEQRDDGSWKLDEYEAQAAPIEAGGVLSVRYDNGHAEGYVVVRYVLTAEGGLAVHLPDRDRLVAAIGAGAIAGTIGDGDDVEITASGASLLAWLHSAAGARSFGPAFAFVRLGDAAAPH